MRCPKCNQPGFLPARTCAKCKFSGDPDLIDELFHITWLRDEMENWAQPSLPPEILQQLTDQYLARQRQLEVHLGLRLPPFTETEAAQAWLKIFRYEILEQKFAEWQAQGDLDPNVSQLFSDQLSERIADLIPRLEGHPRPSATPKNIDQLKIWQYILEVVNRLDSRGGFTNQVAKNEYCQFLNTEIEQLETNLGLRPKLEQLESFKSIPETVTIQVTPTEEPATQTPAPPPPKIPFRERLWRTLLSERTLQAILFLGIFLLFTAAVSFVIWGWRDFSAPLRVAIPASFTLLFFFLGWLVRTKTALYRSGIALSAIAALLIPIDLYTVYVNLGNSPAHWAEFWLAASLVCLLIYTLVTLNIQSRFFGYLVGIAAGSTILATTEVAHQIRGLSSDWSSSGISLLGLALLLTASALVRLPEKNRLRVFIDPFRHLALLSAGVILPLTLAWRYLDRSTFDTLHTAVTIDWWIGGIIFAWGAVHYRSRSLGLLAIVSLPVAVYLTQAGIFQRYAINPAWHAFGLAALVPVYLAAGYRFSKTPDDPILSAHSRSAIGCGLALGMVAALWSLSDLSSGAAAASSHAVLAGTAVLATMLWQRPRYLYWASLFSFTAATFAMTNLGITLGQSSIGWASLALIHIFIAIYLGNRADLSGFEVPLLRAGYMIAALAVIGPLFPYDQTTLIYTLGNWLALTGWGAYLAQKEQPGFMPQQPRWQATFHWAVVIPLPIWVGLLFLNRRPADFSLALGFSALSWGMMALSWRVARLHPRYRRPWRLASLLLSLIAPLGAFWLAFDGFTPAICLLASGLLYFADTLTLCQAGGFIPAGLVTAWGYTLFWARFDLPSAAIYFMLSLLVSTYFLAALWAERRNPHSEYRALLNPLYQVAHGLAGLIIFMVLIPPFDDLLGGNTWSDAMRWWGAFSLLALALAYLLYAWGTYRQTWGHLGIWLLSAGGAFIVITLSSGRGSSAFFGGLGAAILVLTERSLAWLYGQNEFKHRTRSWLRLVWHLYRNPLLVAGWTISVGTIGLALGRNLILLGGGHIQQIWAAAGLTIITGLYAVSARLFRQARFVWFASVLSLLPWTILTNLGWFTPYHLTWEGFAVSWAILSWVLYLISLPLARRQTRYAFPLQVICNLLLLFSLIWATGHNLASRYVIGLALAQYALAAWLNYRQIQQKEISITFLSATKHLYPVLILIPIWSLYWLNWRYPGIGAEHVGILLLLFGSLGLAAGQWLERRVPWDENPRLYGMPAYQLSYAALLVGTLLVSSIQGLLVMALLYDTLLMIVSARLFRSTYFVYPAVILPALALLIVLNVADVPTNRWGWWLIGLAAIYLSQTWLLRKAKLDRYSHGVLAAGLILILLGLPSSSQDQIGVYVGYGSAVLLYALVAFWLRKPLGLSVACSLVVIPYAVAIRHLDIPARFYGLTLFPGAVISLSLGWWLDHKFGTWNDFPWRQPARWVSAFIERLLGWWALPLYTLGFGLAIISPFFTNHRSDLAALNCALMALIFGWAIFRFRLRLWLVALTLALQLSWALLLDWWGWWKVPTYAWQRFAPLTAAMLLAALWLQGHRRESSLIKSISGWSHPLYAFVLLDVALSELMSLGALEGGALVSLINALIMAILASAWRSAGFAYLGTSLGAIALLQRVRFLDGIIQVYPVAFAYLALGYTILGYVLVVIRRRQSEKAATYSNLGWLWIWEKPFQISGLALSLGVLTLAFILGFDLVSWTARALIGIPFRQIVDLATVRMTVQVLSVLGLLYLTTAIVHRKLRLSYLAFGMLLGSWMIYIFYEQQLDGLYRLHWYSLPASLYLLGIAYFEWKQGNHPLARWLDYAAIGLSLGSLFWQTLVFGWRFAILMGAVSLLILWWGSARRLRRFFYAGIIGVILATLGQLLNALQNINQWITFGIIGILLVAIAVIVERRMERIKAWQGTLEDWE